MSLSVTRIHEVLETIHPISVGDDLFRQLFFKQLGVRIGMDTD
jgi:hypothetical protein